MYIYVFVHKCKSENILVRGFIIKYSFFCSTCLQQSMKTKMENCQSTICWCAHRLFFTHVLVDYSLLSKDSRWHVYRNHENKEVYTLLFERYCPLGGTGPASLVVTSVLQQELTHADVQTRKNIIIFFVCNWEAKGLVANPRDVGSTPAEEKVIFQLI